jgi:hypothetical protein
VNQMEYKSLGVTTLIAITVTTKTHYRIIRNCIFNY